MLFLPNAFSLIVLPLINFMVICFTFRDEIYRYDYNVIIKSKYFLKHTYYTLWFALILQAIGNIIIIRFLQIKEPDISFAYHIIAAPIMSVIFSALNEEVIYRKIIFRHLDQKYGFWIGVILSSLIFMVSHYNYAGWLGYFLISVAWCYSYKRTGNIGINIISHVIINLAFFIKVSFMGVG